jgi:hypothetical protein
VTNVSDLFPAGGGNNTIEMVASGALSNGDKVILQSDGTVKVVEAAAASENIPSGSAVTFDSGSNMYPSVSWDSGDANKFIIAYRDGSTNQGTAIVGTVSGTTITFGSEYVFNPGTTSHLDIASDPNTGGKFIITYKDEDNSNYGTAVIGTVSGTTITFGSETVFHSAETNYCSVSWDPNNANKFVLGYKKYWSGNPGVARIGTVSGTTITFGSEYNINSQGTDHLCITYDISTSNKFVATYKDRGNSYYGTVVIGSVSGNVITFGSVVVYNSGGTVEPTSASDLVNADSFIIAFRDDSGTPSQMPAAVAGTINGTTITLGSTTRIFSGTGSYAAIAFYDGEFVMVIQHATNGDYGTAVAGTVSGTTITAGSENVLVASERFSEGSVDIQSGGKVVVAYWGSQLNLGKAILGQLEANATNLTSTNLLGIAKGAAADTETVEVETLGGLATNLSGLTIGSKYYVQDDGTITTSSAGQFLGRAITATTINMKDFT